MTQSMKLFDDIERDKLPDCGEVPKSSFKLLNDYDAWEDAPDLRSKCELWFEHFPAEHRKDIRNRFRSTNNQQHDGAFFELFLHELLIRLGCGVEVNPNVSGKTPDFRVSHGGQSIYIEATAVGRDSGSLSLSSNEQDVIDKLNKLKSSHFCIGVAMEGDLSTTLSRNRVTSPFQALLKDHDPGEVQRSIDKYGLHEAPSERIECGNWTLTGWLAPISPENRSADSLRCIVEYPYRAEPVDPVTSVREALKEKARKYSQLDAPLVLAVNARNPYSLLPGSDTAVLWGDQVLLLGNKSDSTSRYARKQNGFWLSSKGNGPSAVLMFKNVDLLNHMAMCLRAL